MNRQHTTFDELVATARLRGLCVELHDDGIVRKPKSGAEHRHIDQLRVTDRRTRTLVLQYPVSLNSFDGLDVAAGLLLERLPA